MFARYGINAEHLRQKFRTLTKKPDESYTQLGANLARYLDKWLAQEKVQTIQQFKNIIGLKQFYSLLHGEIKYLVKDKKPLDLKQTAEIADFISQIRKPMYSEGKSCLLYTSPSPRD